MIYLKRLLYCCMVFVVSCPIIMSMICMFKGLVLQRSYLQYIWFDNKIVSKVGLIAFVTLLLIKLIEFISNKKQKTEGTSDLVTDFVKKIV